MKGLSLKARKQAGDASPISEAGKIIIHKRGDTTDFMMVDFAENLETARQFLAAAP